MARKPKTRNVRRRRYVKKYNKKRRVIHATPKMQYDFKLDVCPFQITVPTGSGTPYVF